MAEKEKDPEWIWIINEWDGKEEKIYALENAETGRRFIPVFYEQEDGVVCLRKMARADRSEYDVAAMRMSLAAETALEHDMDLVFLDAGGRILDRLTPSC